MNLIPFLYGSSQVRVIEIDGKPWFHGADVCRILDYTNPAKALADHVRDKYKANVSLGLPGSPPTFISEPGLYALIMRSQKPEAEAFQDWIYEDVIPSIREQGGYSLQQPPQFYKRLQLFHERTGRIPAGWFCIFEEIVPLVAQLERHGYCLPEDAVIDGSIGKRFCSYLRDEYDIEPDHVCLKYPHYYPGRRNPVPANLYPLNLIQVFREWLEYRYYNQYLIPYFKGKKDPEALQAVSKFLSKMPSVSHGSQSKPIIRHLRHTSVGLLPSA